MSNEGNDPNREVGPFWIHAINVTTEEMEAPGVSGTIPAVQITIEGEKLGYGDFTASIGLPMTAAADLLVLLGENLRNAGIVK